MPNTHEGPEYRRAVQLLSRAAAGRAAALIDELYGLGLWPDPTAGDDWLPIGHIYYAVRSLHALEVLRDHRAAGHNDNVAARALAQQLDLSRRTTRKIISELKDHPLWDPDAARYRAEGRTERYRSPTTAPHDTEGSASEPSATPHPTRHEHSRQDQLALFQDA